MGLERWYQANRIATLKERRANGVYTRYGGVIFCRKDRKDIRTLSDLKGKSFMAVAESSLGGWLMAWRELKEKGIDPYRDFKELRFDETHDRGRVCGARPYGRCRHGENQYTGRSQR